MAGKTLRQILAENVKSRRLKTGESQEAFAERAKLHRNYPGRIERCESNVTIEVIDKIAKALNTTVCALLGGDEIPRKRQKITTILAQNVKKLRIESGLSQDGLAKRGIHRTYLRSIERERNVSIDTVEKIAKALKVKPYKLFE